MKLAPLALLLAAGCAETSGSTIGEQSTIRERSTIRELTSTRDVKWAHPGKRERPATPPTPSVGLGPCAPLDWPVDGPLSSPFGLREGQRHEGIDLAVGEGTPVRAACEGAVVYAGDKLRGYGRLVIVQHAGGLATVYAHNSLLEVKEGQRVARGQEIARSGATGHVTAPHVHFEVRRDNRPEDPLKYLPSRRPEWTNASR